MSASQGRTNAAWLLLCAAILGCNLPDALCAPYSPTNFNLCGSQFTDGNGITWYGKAFITPSSSGAGCNTASTAITVGTACSPASGSTVCSQSQLQQMLQYQQMGPNLTYTNVGIGSIGKQNTTYAITLYFADFNATCEGERIFNVMINGQTVVTGVDVYALGGGDNSAVSVASPAFYSSSRSSFDIALPTVAGTASILNGLTFQFATSTATTATPSTANYGDTVVLAISSESLNPKLGNLTGSYSAYISGGNIPDGTTTNMTGGLTAANGLYTLDTTWLTSCSGGVINVTVAFNDPKELYGVSTAVVQVTVVGTCLPTTTAPVTTFAPPTTTAAPPTTTIAPDLTSTPYDVSMQMSISPFPGIAGGQSVVSGNATSNTDVPPTGTVEFTLIDTTTIGALTAPAPPAVRRRPSFSFAAVGRSTFTFTFPTPSLGDYVIMASILSPNGTKVPISDPAVMPFLVVGPANVLLTFDSGHNIGVIGPDHYCKVPVRAKATITAPTGATTPTGNVTFAITNAHARAIPVQLIIAKALGNDGNATFVVNPNPAAAAFDALWAFTTGSRAVTGKLPPGTYNATATFHGNAIYPPATTTAEIVVSPKCPLTTILLS